MVSADGKLKFESITNSNSNHDPFFTEAAISASQISLESSKPGTSSRVTQPNSTSGSKLVDQNLISEYDKFLKNQRSPLLHAKAELFKLGETVWHRDYGDEEYYLTPSTQNLKAYKDRIREEDNKQLGIKKSTFQHIKIIVNNTSKTLLNDMGISVPMYVTESVNVYLPILDIEKFGPKLVEDRSKFSTSFQDVIPANEDFSDQTKSVIWSDGFEGSFPGSTYTVGDLNSTNGLDYWDDLTCKSHAGSYSIWCADIGDQPDCQNYDDYMESYVYKTSGVNVSGYTNLIYKAYLWYDTELGYDDLEKYYSTDGITWTYYSSYGGNSNGWDLFEVSLTGTWITYYWKWVFFSDYSICNYEGAYIDDMEITGDATTVLPNLTCDPNNYTSLTVTNQTIVDMNVRVINDGQASAGSSYLGYYLSEDDNITTSDWLFGDDYVASLSIGAHSDENIYIDVTTVTPTIPPGTYYVAFIIDHLEQVVESNENDNAWYWTSPTVTITAFPNLTCDPNNFTSLDVINQTVVDMNVRVINDGQASAGSSYLGYYLSEDENITTSDWLFGDDYVTSLAPGAYSDESIYIDVTTVTPTIPPGEYFVAFIIDHLEQVDESNENDNAWYWTDPKVVIDPNSLSVNPSYQYVGPDAGSFQVQVSSNVDWTVSESCPWLSCNPTNGSNNGSFTVNYQSNTTTNSRTCVITVSGEGQSATVTVNQAPINAYLAVNPTAIVKPKESGSFSVQVSSNIDWGVSESCTWLSCSPTNGSNNGTFTVTYEENTSQNSRTGIITVSGSSLTETVTLTQNGTIYLLSINPISKTVGPEEGNFQVEVTSNIIWEIEENCSWITCSPTNGINNGTFTVNYDANPMQEVRMDMVTVKGQGEEVTLTLFQQGDFFTLTVDPTLIDLGGYAGNSSQFSISSNVFWYISNFPSWLDISCISGQGNATITITANSTNVTPNIRIAALAINGEDVSTVQVVVTQASVLNIDDHEMSKSVIVFPIPAKDEVYISAKNETISIETVEILNGIGILVHRHIPDNKFNIVNLSLNSYEQGLYVLKIKTNQGDVLRKLLIKRD